MITLSTFIKISLDELNLELHCIVDNRASQDNQAVIVWDSGNLLSNACFILATGL